MISCESLGTNRLLCYTVYGGYRMSRELLSQMKTSGIVAVIRASSENEAIHIAHMVIEGGVRVIEVTYTVPQPEKVLSALVQEYADSDVLIGAGTIMCKDMAIAAVRAGARFLVSPAFDREVALFAMAENLPYIPGCLTPTEIVQARNFGVSIIKLFPGSAFGPSYVKALLGPFPDLCIMPTGGVSLTNIHEWFEAGVVMIGVGGELTRPAQSGDYQAVKENAQRFVAEVRRALEKKESLHG